MSCQGCESCQSCNGKCNVTCNSCEGTCDTKQNFCKTNQLASAYVTIPKFRDKNLLQPDDLFLTAQNWNDFITSIYNAYCKGKKRNAYSSNTPDIDTFSIYDNMDIRAGKAEGKATGTSDFMYAKMYNGALKKMRFLVNNNAGENKVSPNDIVTASLFNELRNYATDSFLLNPIQCDACNSGCDVTCDACEGCNSTQCNSPCGNCCNDPPPEKKE